MQAPKHTQTHTQTRTHAQIHTHKTHNTRFPQAELRRLQQEHEEFRSAHQILQEEHDGLIKV